MLKDKINFTFLLIIITISLLFISGCSSIFFSPYGSIEVTTYPSGAKIFLDGKDIEHVTPYTINNLAKGTYEITVTLGNISYTEKLKVYSNITSSVYKDLVPRLNKILVQPSSMNLEIGESKSIDSITAYYIGSGSTVINPNDCNYSSSSNHAIVDSVGTITGVSKGSATITVSYTDVEITKTDTINVNVFVETEPPIIVPEDGAPIANIQVTPGSTGIVPFTVSFDASGSSTNGQSGSSITSYSWDFGDSDTDTGIIVTHTYNNIGLYPVILTIADSNGKTDYATVTITVNEPGAPTAVISTVPEPPTGFAPLEIHFNAYNSSADVDITSYDWVFGDGSTGTGASINHTFNATGIYVATLTVTDSNGKEGYDTVIITVNESGAPTARINTTPPSPPTGIAPFEVYFDAYGSYVDSACGFECEIVSYEWDFGDGDIGTGVTLNHTYSNVGTYTAVLTVTDSNGKKGYANVPITVKKAPIAVIRVIPGDTGMASFKVYFDAYESTSESGIVSYEWDFGDGNTGIGITTNNTYDAAGSYIVYLTITDSNGYEAYDSVTITVNETGPPTAVINTVPSPTEGMAPFEVYFDAYESTSESGIVSYEWEFGDGDTGDGITVNHTYAAGIYIVYLTITDSNGYEAYDSVTITVYEPGAPYEITVTATPTEVDPGGGDSAITANVKDWGGNPVTDLTIVTFGTTSGILSETSVATSGGIATTTLTLSSEGSATVTAVCGPVSDTVIVTCPAVPAP
jgi:PKD repeat protein